MRAKTIRRIKSPLARDMARLANEQRSLATKIKNLVEKVNSLQEQKDAFEKMAYHWLDEYNKLKGGTVPAEPAALFAGVVSGDVED